MVPTGKWIDGLCADCSVEDAARRSLEARLASVTHWLPLAAYLPEHDVEHVHRLRVSTRRAVAALRLYGDRLRRKPARWMKKRLKEIRQAAGDARDLDVLTRRLSRDYGERAEPVVALIAQRRAAVQPAIVTMADRCRRDDRFIRKTAKLLAAIRPPKQHAAQPQIFTEWAAQRLTEAADTFFTAMPEDSADAAGLHEFRIRGKSLRYTIELVAPAFGPELRSEHYPIVEALQERLGKIQDHVTAGARVSDWANETEDTVQQEVMRELATAESARQAKSIADFRDWWTPDRAAKLRQGIESAATYHAATPLPPDAPQT